jgi:hypothetical protein
MTELPAAADPCDLCYGEAGTGRGEGREGGGE